MTLEELKVLGHLLGYTFRRTETDTQITETMIRPDGSVAITAQKAKSPEPEPER